jgi:glycosyltransferase involved in cell wall biosynthesis
MTDGNPLISIIIPVRNGIDTIDKSINSILSLAYAPVEVIVVDDGSADGTAEKLDAYRGKIRVITAGGAGPSLARNAALKQAKGSYIAFTDADCVVDRNWLDELYAGFSTTLTGIDKDTIAAVGGDQLSPADETVFGRTVNAFMKTIGFVADYIRDGRDCGVTEVDHNPSCNVLYKREVVERVNGFAAGLWPGEDLDLDYRIKRLGFRLLYTPKAKVYHYRSPSLKRFMRMMFNYGRAQGILVRWYGFFRRIHVLPPLALTGLLALPFIGARTAFLALFSAGFIFLLFFFVRSRNIATAGIYCGLLLCTVVCWLAGFAKGIVVEK